MTVNLDDKAAARARALAAARNCPIEQVIAALLSQAPMPANPGAALVQLARQHPVETPPGWRFRRESCYDGERGP